MRVQAILSLMLGEIQERKDITLCRFCVHYILKPIPADPAGGYRYWSLTKTCKFESLNHERL